MMESENSESEKPKSKRSNSAIYCRNTPRSDISAASRQTQITTLNSAPSSSHSTPKRIQKVHQPDFMITGKKMLCGNDRANSVTGVFARRKSVDSITGRKITPKRVDESKHKLLRKEKSREHSMEDDLKLNVSQISDTLPSLSNKRQILKKKMPSLATSTPRNQQQQRQKPRSASVQGMRNGGVRRREETFDSYCSSGKSVYSCADSVIGTSSAGTYIMDRSTDLDCSSISPCSQSSCEFSPRNPSDVAVVSPFTQTSQTSGSSFYSSWMESDLTQHTARKQNKDGGWDEFWENYNNSPMKSYYDLCPTPYQNENFTIDNTDLPGEPPLVKSPGTMAIMNSLIRNEGINLTPKETQSLLKCTHFMGNVLTKALDRNTKEKQSAIEQQKISELLHVNTGHILENNISNTEMSIKKSNLTLNLKEEVPPLKIKIENESVWTQTDISLPNTKSAPRIFEKILRQLSRTSIDEQNMSKNVDEITVPVVNLINLQEDDDNKLLSGNMDENVKRKERKTDTEAPSVE